MDGELKLSGACHLNLVVSDVERAARFYQELLGMELQWREGQFVFLCGGALELALVQGRPLIHRRFHFGFRVGDRDEVDRWLERVRAHGAAITHGPADYGEYYTFSLRDPDGYAIEIYAEGPTRGRAGDVTQEDG